MPQLTPLSLLLFLCLASTCLFGTASAQDAASTPTVPDNDSAAGYSSYVSAMKLNDLKETATFSWASVASSGAPRQQAAEVSNAGSAAAASSSSSSDDDLAAITDLAAEVQASPSATPGTTSSNAETATPSTDKSMMMGVGIGIAFGVLALIIGLVTSMIIYNRRKARKAFAERTRGLQQRMTETDV